MTQERFSNSMVLNFHKKRKAKFAPPRPNFTGPRTEKLSCRPWITDQWWFKFLKLIKEPNFEHLQNPIFSLFHVIIFWLNGIIKQNIWGTTSNEKNLKKSPPSNNHFTSNNSPLPLRGHVTNASFKQWGWNLSDARNWQSTQKLPYTWNLRGNT